MIAQKQILHCQDLHGCAFVNMILLWSCCGLSYCGIEILGVEWSECGRNKKLGTQHEVRMNAEGVWSQLGTRSELGMTSE